MKADIRKLTELYKQRSSVEGGPKPVKLSDPRTITVSKSLYMKVKYFIILLVHVLKDYFRCNVFRW